jgi:hypothetical protein
MPDYLQSKVYKITGGGLVYIGSTTQTLAQRLSDHRSSLKAYNSGKRQHLITSFQILNLPDCCITLVEDVKCERKEQLLARERYWIENTTCVNRMVPLRTKAEYRMDNSEENKNRCKAYYEGHKVERLEAEKLRYQANKAVILERVKQYSQNNKAIIQERAKNYRVRIKDVLKERKKVSYEKNKKKIECECGVIHLNASRTKHLKSAGHLAFIQNK